MFINLSKSMPIDFRKRIQTNLSECSAFYFSIIIHQVDNGNSNKIELIRDNKFIFKVSRFGCQNIYISKLEFGN